MNSWSPILLLAALMCLLPAAAPQAQERRVPGSADEVTLSYAALVRQTAPAVVNIYASRRVQTRVTPFFDDPFFQRFFGDALPMMPRERLQNALGSGVIVAADGLVMTNAHVIDGADAVRVVLADRREFEAEVLVEDGRTDLAALRIDTEGEALPFLELKDSDDVAVGDLVLAIGNPFGVGQTVTSGIVSALARTAVGVSDFSFFIQTDAAINPGNSGGALVDTTGRLIGIPSAIYSRDGGSLGIGFAVPSNMVRTVIAAVEGDGMIRRPWLGATGQPVTAELAEELGLRIPAGVLINDVWPGGPADEAGIELGDVITQVGDQVVDGPGALRFRIATLEPGERTELTLVRRGRERTARLEATLPPAEPPPDRRQLAGRHPLSGTEIANLSPALADELGLEGEYDGVVITRMARQSAAGRVGVRPGDIVLRINDQEPSTTAELERLLEQPRDAWRLRLKRNGRPVDIVVRG